MHAQGEIVGSTGYIDVEFNLPQEDVLIYGLQFSYTLPYGVQLLGGPENTIGNGWDCIIITVKFTFIIILHH